MLCCVLLSDVGCNGLSWYVAGCCDLLKCFVVAGVAGVGCCLLFVVAVFCCRSLALPLVVVAFVSLVVWRWRGLLFVVACCLLFVAGAVGCCWLIVVCFCCAMLCVVMVCCCCCSLS